MLEHALQDQRSFSSCRTVQGLATAQFSACPWPKSRPRGAKAQGLRYERALSKALPSAKHNLWFEFWDKNGRGFCSPDFLLEFPQFLVVLEAKYTDTDAGREQIEHLYRPILAKLYAKPIRGVLVCRNLLRSSRNIYHDLNSAIASAEFCIPTLHWLGKGPL